MIRGRRVAATALVAALALGACGGQSAAPQSASGAHGDPVAGGTARLVQITEPRSLDPAALGNEWVLNAFLGNALYGTLLSNDPETGQIEYTMAEDFSTDDGGKTFELTLRPGLTFSDGTSLDAAAVKFNWDRIKDPATGSSNLAEAAMIESSTVVDDTTLEIAMTESIPQYAQAIVTTPMNWIASPKALRKGQRAFDANPIGAGPFTLTKWSRQDVIELAENPGYWDSPKPYLDAITVRTSSDAGQRINTVMSGGADVAIETNWNNIAKAREAGFQADTVPLSGGFTLTMNTRRPPFDDPRARQAIAAALDLDAMNSSVYNGKAKLPHTLFTESSPFYADIQLTRGDEATAQRLFAELAAEGKPVEFTFTSGPTSEIKNIAESVQAQLSGFDNVDVKVNVVDITEVIELRTTFDFDMTVSSAHFVDPEPRLWTVFHGDSRRNLSGIDDEELNSALDAGRTAATTEGRKAAYERVQQRLRDLAPVVFNVRSAPSAVVGKNVGGLRQYGHGSLLPAELWLEQ